MASPRPDIAELERGIRAQQRRAAAEDAAAAAADSIAAAAVTTPPRQLSPKDVKALVGVFKPADDPVIDRPAFAAFETRLASCDPGLHDAMTADTPRGDDRADLARMLNFLADGAAFTLIQNIDDGRAKFDELRRAYGVDRHSDGSVGDSLGELVELSFNTFPSPGLIAGEIRRLKAAVGDMGPRGDALLTNALIAALKPPRAPPLFAGLHAQLLFVDSPTVDGILGKLTTFYNKNRDDLTPRALGLVAGDGRLRDPPAPPRPTTVAEPKRTWCAVCYGVGHAAGDCPSDPAQTSDVCAFCCYAGHSTAACNSKPPYWQLGHRNRAFRREADRDVARNRNARDSRTREAHGADPRAAGMRPATANVAFDFDAIAW